MVKGIDPMISVTSIKDQYLTSDTSLNLNKFLHKDDKFFLGFGLRDWGGQNNSYGKESWRHDPRFVKFTVAIDETF
jgi:hypothetical protein